MVQPWASPLGDHPEVNRFQCRYTAVHWCHVTESSGEMASAARRIRGKVYDTAREANNPGIYTAFLAAREHPRIGEKMSKQGRCNIACPYYRPKGRYYKP